MGTPAVPQPPAPAAAAAPAPSQPPDPPRYRKPAAGPTAEDLADQARWRELTGRSLSSTQAAAEKWRPAQAIRAARPHQDHHAGRDNLRSAQERRGSDLHRPAAEHLRPAPRPARPGNHRPDRRFLLISAQGLRGSRARTQDVADRVHAEAVGGNGSRLRLPVIVSREICDALLDRLDCGAAPARVSAHRGGGESHVQ